MAAPSGTWSLLASPLISGLARSCPRREGVVLGWGSSFHGTMFIGHLYHSWLAEFSKNRHVTLGLSDPPNLA